MPFANTGKLCLPCRRVYDAGWRARRKAEGLPSSGRRMPREYERAREVIYYAKEETRQRRNANMRSYTKAHATREHHVARWKVNRAIATGRLTRQPCSVCGAERVDAHHDDYSKPLDVRWLCREHHLEHHARAEPPGTNQGKDAP